MKIVHVVNSLEYGGLEQLTLQLVKKLNEAGVSSDIVCLTKKGGLAPEAEAAGITVKELGKKDGFNLGLISRLAKECRELKADIIHTHNFAPLIYGTLAAKLLGKKCLNTRHGRTDDSTFGLLWQANQFVVPVSEDTKNHLLKHNRIPTKKIQLIFNGVDLKKYDSRPNPEGRSALLKKLGIPEDSFVVANVGRLSPEKDQETLLKAFRRLRSKNINSDLLLVGDGNKRKDLEAKAKEFNIADRVHFLGFRDDVVQILKASDVFVLSSYREGLSLSILEAMACGKPVIATKIGGTPEVVIDGETGYLVPCGFPERIEVAISKLYINRKLAAQLGENARRKIEEQFDFSRTVEAYRKLYNQMV